MIDALASNTFCSLLIITTSSKRWVWSVVGCRVRTLGSFLIYGKNRVTPQLLTLKSEFVQGGRKVTVAEKMVTRIFFAVEVEFFEQRSIRMVFLFLDGQISSRPEARNHGGWRFLPVETGVCAGTFGQHVVQKYLCMELSGVEFPPMIGLASEVDHGIARLEFEAGGQPFLRLKKNRPNLVLCEVQCKADLAGIPVPMTQQFFTILIDSSIGVGRQHCFAAELGDGGGFFNKQSDKGKIIVRGR